MFTGRPSTSQLCALIDLYIYLALGNVSVSLEVQCHILQDEDNLERFAGRFGKLKTLVHTYMPFLKGFERYKLGLKTEELMLARIRCLVPSSPQIQKSERLREEKVEY